MKKLTALLTVLALLACLLAGCAGEAEPSETVAASANAGETGAVSTNKEPIKVGVLAPLTGTMAEFGKTYEVAMTMAAEDINEAGGINGRELVLQFEDSKGDQNQSAELASKFADDDEIGAILVDDLEQFIFHLAFGQHDGGVEAGKLLVHIVREGIFIGLAAFLNELFHHALAAGAAQNRLVVGGDVHKNQLGIVLAGDVVDILSHIVRVFGKADAADDIGKNRHGIILLFHDRPKCEFLCLSTFNNRERLVKLVLKKTCFPCRTPLCAPQDTAVRTWTTQAFPARALLSIHLFACRSEHTCGMKRQSMGATGRKKMFYKIFMK